MNAISQNSGICFSSPAACGGSGKGFNSHAMQSTDL
jgi:hypothetical protein